MNTKIRIETTQTTYLEITVDDIRKALKLPDHTFLYITAPAYSAGELEIGSNEEDCIHARYTTKSEENG